MLYPTSEIHMLVDGLLDHPECVALGPDGNLYAGGEAGQVYRISPGGSGVHEYASTDGWCGGIAMDREGNAFVCDAKRREVMRVTPAGVCETFSDGSAERKFVLPNYPVFDRHGNLYVSCSGGWKQRNGVIFRIAPTGETALWSHGPFHFTNGLALDAAEKYLYVVESNLDRVLRIAIREDLTAGDVSVFANEFARVPDGLAFDAAGNLYVTCYASHRLYCVSPAGVVEVLAEDSDGATLNEPTNCCFGGPDFDRLYVSNLGGYHLAALDLRVKGQKLYSHNG